MKFDPDIHGPAPVLKGYFKSRGLRSGRERGNFGGIQPKHVCRLNLDRTLEDVMASFTPKTRYNIRLAEKKGVEIIEGSLKDIPDFYSVLEETCDRDNFRVRSMSYFEDLYENFITRGNGKLLLAKYDGRCIAGIFIVSHGPKAWYLYGASSNNYRDVMPNYLLQWTAIKWAHQQGCKIYDFLGVASSFDPNSPLYGMYRFKRGFNPEVVEFIGEYDLILNKKMYHFWNVAEPLYLKSQVNIGKTSQYLKKLLNRNRGYNPVVE